MYYNTRPYYPLQGAAPGNNLYASYVPPPTGLQPFPTFGNVSQQNFQKFPQPSTSAKPRPRPRAQSTSANAAPSYITPTTPFTPKTVKAAGKRGANNTMEYQLRSGIASPAMSAWEALPTTADVKEDVVTDLMRQVGTVRVGVEIAAGRGSVSASMAALKELIRQAKSDTEFQVVYESGAQNALGVVLGQGFSPELARQNFTINGKTIKFIRDGYLDVSDQPTQRGRMIGFVGANDAPDHPARRWYNILGNNRAGNVDAVGVAQPYGWKYGGPQSIVTDTHTVYLHPLYKRSKGFPIKVPNWSASGISDAFNKSSQPEHKAMAAVFGGLASNAIDVMPIYGLHHPQMKKKVGQEDNFVRNIFGGIWKAHKKGLPKKPVVLVVVGDYSKGEIRRFDSHSNTRYDPHTIRYADDPSTPERMKRLKPGEVMLLYAGKVEQAYFEQLFRLSTLPPFVEGANAANLCQNLQDKPYLHMIMDGTSFPDTSNHDNALTSGKKDAVATSNALESNRVDSHIHERLGTFIYDSRMPESDVQTYFSRVNKETRESNQVVDILYHMSEEIGVGPEREKIANKLQRRVMSPSTNVMYELWTNGSIFYRESNISKPAMFKLSELKPKQEGQNRFGRDHRELSSDILFTDIAFSTKSLRQMFNSKPANLVLSAKGAVTNETYLFEYEEQTATLILKKKNNRDIDPPIEYIRPSDRDNNYTIPVYKNHKPKLRKRTFSLTGKW